MDNINQSLIDNLKGVVGTSTLMQDKIQKEIVPKDQTHQFLISQFSIDEIILQFYFSHTIRYYTEKQINQYLKGYFGKKEEAFSPYPFVFYGAYFNRIDLLTKLQILVYQKTDERPTINGKKIKTLLDLDPYFRKYAEGFKNGYESFEEECIKKYLPLFPDKHDFAQRVFEYVTNDKIFKNTWLNNHSGFTTQHKTKNQSFLKNGEIINSYEDGQKQGYFYKAWCIVFSNNTLFAPLFQERIKIKASPPQQSTKEDLNENTEPNNFTISTIEDWLFEFKERNILTEPHYTNLVNALTHYFENGAFPKLKQPIKVGRVNKKLLGWHLNRIFHSKGKGVEIDLLSFSKASISTFKDVEFDEKDIQNSNLYKYFTTKTK